MVRLRVTAEAGGRSKVQTGLFTPPMPEAGRLEVTLARLAGLVGEGRVGRARLLDSHAPESFAMEKFCLPTAVEMQRSGRGRTRRDRAAWQMGEMERRRAAREEMVREKAPASAGKTEATAEAKALIAVREMKVGLEPAQGGAKSNVLSISSAHAAGTSARAEQTSTAETEDVESWVGEEGMPRCALLCGGCGRRCRSDGGVTKSRRSGCRVRCMTCGNGMGRGDGAARGGRVRFGRGRSGMSRVDGAAECGSCAVLTQ